MSAGYLVTGAAGFIGSHVCDRLIREGHRVRAVDRFSSYYARADKEANIAALRQSPAFELIECDLAEADITGMLDGVDAVIHLAAQPGVRASWGDGFVDYVRDNIIATQRLFDALVANPLPTVVASSSSVYGNAGQLPVVEGGSLQPVSPYGLTKLAVEELARIYVDQHRIHAVALRFFTVYGPRQRPDMAFTRFLTAALYEAELRVLGDGSQSRDFTYVSDVVDAILRALAAPSGRVFNIGGGQPTSINMIIATLEELLGRALYVVHEPAALGDVRNTWADTTRARKELNWSPRTDIHSGLAAQLSWLRGSLDPKQESDDLVHDWAPVR